MSYADGMRMRGLISLTKAAMKWFSLNNCLVHTSMPCVNLCPEVVERIHAVKYLGIQFDRSLAFTRHVNKVVMKAKNKSGG